MKKLSTILWKMISTESGRCGRICQDSTELWINRQSYIHPGILVYKGKMGQGGWKHAQNFENLSTFYQQIVDNVCKGVEIIYL